MHKDMRALWRKNWPYIIAMVVFIFLSEGTRLFIDVEKGKVVDAALLRDYSGLLSGFAYLLVLSLAMPLCFYLFTLALQSFRVNAESELRSLLFGSIVGRSYASYLKNPEGRYLSVYTDQLAELENSYFFSHFGLAQIVANYIVSLFLIPRLHPLLLLAVLATLIPTLAIPELFKGPTTKARREEIESKERNLGKLNELLYGLETIFSYSRRESYYRLFCEDAATLRDKGIKRRALQLTGFQLSSGLIGLCSAILLLITAKLLAEGKLSTGDYVLSLGIGGKLIGNMPYTSHYLQQLHTVRANIRSIFRTIREGEQDMQAEATKRESGLRLDEALREIRFADVSFRYEKESPDRSTSPSEAQSSPGTQGRDDYIFEHFNWSVEQPGIHLIRGESGSGKSTLISLLAAYYPLEGGQITINRMNIEKVANLNELIGIMRQDAIFFDGSLKENLCMFRETSDAQIIEEMKHLGLEKYATTENLNAPVGQYSGGEARRMMLLRCLLRDSPILVLDEPLANLDALAMQKIEDRLAELSEGNSRFILLISHQRPNLTPVSELLIEAPIQSITSQF